VAIVRQRLSEPPIPFRGALQVFSTLASAF
jgi:hypothetical protein